MFYKHPREHAAELCCPSLPQPWDPVMAARLFCGTLRQDAETSDCHCGRFSCSSTSFCFVYFEAVLSIRTLGTAVVCRCTTPFTMKGQSSSLVIPLVLKVTLLLLQQPQFSSG